MVSGGRNRGHFSQKPPGRKLDLGMVDQPLVGWGRRANAPSRLPQLPCKR